MKRRKIEINFNVKSYNFEKIKTHIKIYFDYRSHAFYGFFYNFTATFIGILLIYNPY